MHSLLCLVLSNYHYKLNKMQYHNTLAFKKCEKLANNNLENFVLGPRPWPSQFLFLASRGPVFEKSVFSLGLKRCIFRSTFAIYDVYKNVWKNGSNLPNRFQNAILVLEPTLLVVIRV